MALESGTYVKDLVITNPPGTDAISQGDDHIRLIKTVLKNSFPSNSSAPILPDIAGNGDKYLQVNSGATATQWVALDVNALTRRKGEVHRATFEYVSGTSIKIYPGIYDLSNKGQNVSWDTALTVTGLSGTDQWVYIYLDESAITAGVDVTANEIIGSTTVPTWSDGKHGWYNGEDRCIFGVYFEGSAITKFYHDGGNFIQYANHVEHGDVDGGVGWTPFTLRAPVMAKMVRVGFDMRGIPTTTLGSTFHYRSDTSSTTGITIGRVEPGSGSYEAEHNAVMAEVATYLSGNDRLIQVDGDSPSHNYCIVRSHGWFAPTGM